MSATSRGAERVEDENYPTPTWCVHRLWDGLNELGIAPQLKMSRWHEIMAGDGAIIRAFRELGASPDRWVATELRESPRLLEFGPLVEKVRMPCDYLTAPPVEADVIITNPAFSIAQEAITKALKEAPYVIQLLRLNFKGSEERNAWLRGDMPDELALPNRPQFIASYKCEPRDDHDRGCGWKLKLPIDAPKVKICPDCGRKVSRVASDSAEYGWLVWTPERGRRIGRSLVLPTSTPEERGVLVRRKKAA